MKNKILAIATIATALSMNATAQNYFPSSGNVGINTGSAPIYPFQINSDVNFSYQPSVSPTWARRAIFGNSDGGLSLYGKSWNSGSGITLRAQNSYYGNGSIEFTAFNTNTSSTDDAFVFDKMTTTGGAQSTLMTIDYQGNIIPYGDIKFQQQSINSYRRQLFANSAGGLSLYSNTGDVNGSSITLKSNGSYYGDGSILFTAGGSLTTSGSAFEYNIYNGGSYRTLMNVTYDGTIIPSGNISFQPQGSVSPTWARRQIFGNSDGGLSLYGKTNESTGSNITLRSNGSHYGDGNIEMMAGGTPTTSGHAFIYDLYNNGAYGPTLMAIDYDGKVVIGNVSKNTTNDYRLYVEKGILTEKVKVAMSSDPTNWSDFVFADDYKLKSLNEVENYIGKHKHLPEIPSTAEVHANGIDLAEIDAKLLQKIEELTLYVIQQQKEIDGLKKKLK